MRRIVRIEFGLAQMAELRGDDWPAGDTEIEAFLARYGLGG